MKTDLLLTLTIVTIVALSSCDKRIPEYGPDYNVHIFYYGWFGNPETDGDYRAWNHQVVPHWTDTT